MTKFAIVIGAVAALACLASLSGEAGAQPVNSKAARKALFRAKGSVFQVVARPWLAKADIKVLNSLPKLMKRQGMALKYYGAIAAVPAQGAQVIFSAPTTLFAMAHHSVLAAETAALAGCNAKRDPAAPPCEIIARVRPKGWKPGRALQMNADASAAFVAFRRAAAPKAMAISPATGQWAEATAMPSAAAAVAKALRACNKSSADVNDCEIAIQD